MYPLAWERGNIMPSIQLIATDLQDRTLTLAIDGVRYEYWIRGNFEAVERQFKLLLRKGASGKALALVKRNTYREMKR